MADKEFALCEVPKEEKKSFFSLAIVWMGFVFIITSMMAGGGLAKGLNIRDIILVTVLGNIFLSFIAGLVSIIACKTGLTFALLTRYTFGLKGSRLASLFVPVVNIGWYTIQAATYGHFLAMILGVEGFGEGILMAISAIIMGIFAIIGIRAITILGYIAIPAIIFLSVFTAVKATSVVGGVSALFSYEPIETLPLGQGIAIVVGTWILSTSTCIADIMRYAKNVKEAIWVGIIGLLGGNVLMIMCGAIAAIAVEESDLTVILLGFGLVFPSLILMTTNIFTTNAANLYSTSLNLANVFSWDRRKILTAILIISALATFTRPYEIGTLFTFLGALGLIVPPLPGIILTDYFVIHRGEYSSLKCAEFKNWGLIAWGTWAISAGIAYFCPYGLPSLNGLVSSSIIYFVAMSLLNGGRK